MSEFIRIRVCLAVVAQGKILLVPHFATSAGAVQWVVPGGQVEFGESLKEAAVREFFEETGLQAQALELLDVSEVILADRPYHSITISFSGRVSDGTLRAEPNHPYGEKMPRWFSAAEIETLKVHPERTITKALVPGGAAVSSDQANQHEQICCDSCPDHDVSR